jgi:hypothetical protein
MERSSSRFSLSGFRRFQNALASLIPNTSVPLAERTRRYRTRLSISRERRAENCFNWQSHLPMHRIFLDQVGSRDKRLAPARMRRSLDAIKIYTISGSNI